MEGYQFHPLFARSMALVLSFLLPVCADVVLAFPTGSTQIAEAAAREDVTQMAREITVRVLSESGAGSGTIVDRSGSTYTVLTNDHVLPEGETYSILTADGSRHAAWRLDAPAFGELDLALMQFTSDRPYSVAQRGNSATLEIGESIYAAGFPNWQPLGEDAIEDTRDWGFDAFALTRGEVGMKLERSLARGYQLGYTNDVRSGMSGGPVLDASGQLVGINGRLKSPIQGIDAFILEDGSQPSPQLFAQMEGFSWAIPISTFEALFEALAWDGGSED
ncbi:MAG: serine protease [Cyanobacteriota bacterium]|nr:serine protease [Cyanobacteriota bacterium]